MAAKVEFIDYEIAHTGGAFATSTSINKPAWLEDGCLLFMLVLHHTNDITAGDFSTSSLGSSTSAAWQWVEAGRFVEDASAEPATYSATHGTGQVTLLVVGFRNLDPDHGTLDPNLSAGGTSEDDGTGSGEIINTTTDPQQRTVTGFTGVGGPYTDEDHLIWITGAAEYHSTNNHTPALVNLPDDLVTWTELVNETNHFTASDDSTFRSHFLAVHEAPAGDYDAEGDTRTATDAGDSHTLRYGSLFWHIHWERLVEEDEEQSGLLAPRARRIYVTELPYFLRGDRVGRA
jgi:hypothetical protein